MTSAAIRQSFLDFFHQQQHTLVPSSSLLPDSPGLLFTNAGMNQFVPIFLGDRKPDVASWAGVVPASHTRAADTQKCIRAGGKHNDLEDVGWDTYHHTMFEMLGNWSFGDYFKKESLTWGWQLLTKVWGIPAKRLFATVYSPNKAKNDPSEFDQEAYDIWAGLFRAEGLDPAVHIVNGNKKDNFWMMGDTGPCGPCSEIHFNLLASDDEAEGRKLVNGGSPRCIEIWNHVFIQFNANADGTFAPLAAKHVDTGMGFERVAGIYATTKGFKEFGAEPSNYNSDVFTQLFDVLEKRGGRRYGRTVPKARDGLSEQEKTDIAFRVLADHARCVSCAIADGILPGNDGRNYVIRRILRRGILYGKKLGLSTGFFEQLVAPVVASLGSVFPELKQQQSIVERVIRGEEESFGRTLDRGLEIFHRRLASAVVGFFKEHGSMSDMDYTTNMNVVNLTPDGAQSLLGTSRAIPVGDFEGAEFKSALMNAGGPFAMHVRIDKRYDKGLLTNLKTVAGALAFDLSDTYGFPVDMTQLLAAEYGMVEDVQEYESCVKAAQERSRAAQKKEVIVAAKEGETIDQKPTIFLGYSELESVATLVDVVRSDKDTFLVFDQSPFYAEMGGQTGDTGTISIGGNTLTVADTVKDKSGRFLHRIGKLQTPNRKRQASPALSAHPPRSR